MKNHRKIIGVVTALLIFGNTVVLADPLADQLQKQQEQLKQDKNQLNSVGDRREEIEVHLEHLDVQIENTMNDIENGKKQILSAENEIKTSEQEAKKTEEEVKIEQDNLSLRLRAMYKNGQATYFKMLFESTGIGDLISRVEAIKSIVSFDKKVINDLKLKQEELNRKKEALKVQKDNLTALKAENENKLASLSEASKEQNKLVVDLRAQEKIYAAKVKESQAQVDVTMKQIQAIRDAVPKYDPSRGAAPISNNSIIAYASNFLGTPYVWGGTTPNPGFDCSGFTSYVYRHFGVGIGRTTYDQINDGVGVSRDQLQPGDLVFFGTWSNPHHVGIYVGNNSYIHAPRTGDSVKISALTRSDYVTARRVK